MDQKLPFGLLLEDVIGYSYEIILVDDQMTRHNSEHLVSKGSLVTVMSQKEAMTRADQINFLPNYKYVTNKLTIALNCNPAHIFPLTKNQRALLNGVARESDRIEVVQNLDWVEKLHFGSYVYVTIPTIPTPVKGVIYHIGHVDGEAGTKFAIELQEGRGEGTSDGTFRGVDYFECEPNCAVFVSMDKLVQMHAVEAAKGVAVTRQVRQPQDDKPLRLGDKVKVFDKDGNPIKGTVRSLKKNVLGIEAEKRLALVDIPGQVEDNKKRIDFTIVQHHHTKLFLPAHLVVRYDSNASPHNLTVGSLIQFGNPPCYGVIKWIGSLPKASCVMAGVELENIIDNYTDGIYEGVQYFKSQLRRGIFVKLQALQPDKRFVPQKYFYIGSRVQFGRDKECGVITWMGSVPGCDEECVKIITKDNEESGFIPLSAIQLESRYDNKPNLLNKCNLWTQHDLEQIVLNKTENILLPKDIETEVLQCITVLLVTVTINESLATLSYLQPLVGHRNIYKFTQGVEPGKVIVYYVGKYGACPAAVTQVPSDFQVHNSTRSISIIADQCFPNLGGIISVGVACGVKGKVEMCDVVVSSKVVNYDRARNEHEGYSPRGEAIVVPYQLSKLFNQPVQWPNDTIRKRLNDNGTHIPNVRFGVILSGPYYANDSVMKKTLIRNFACEALCIEMSRSHLVTTNQQTIPSTVVVKAVCDFGDGKNKKVYQSTAALLAADVVNQCLSDPKALDMLKGKILLHQMLQQAKNEGLTINVRQAKILFCGPAKAGKTSFSRLLRNEKHEADYNSTVAGDTQQVLMSEKVNAVSKKVNVVNTSWISLNHELETQQITDRLILKLHNQKDNKKDVNNNTHTKSTCVQAAAEATHTNSAIAPELEPKESLPVSQSFSSASNNEMSMLTNNEVESPDDNMQANKQIGIEKQMVTFTDNVNTPISELADTIPETWDLFTLVDTGGQPEFINLLPAINNSTAITFVVMNLSNGKDYLSNLVTAQYKSKGYNYYVHDLKYTNIHLLKCLLSSIKVSAMKKDNFQLESVKKLTEDEHPRPVVCIIGTCADILREKFGEKYNEELSKINEEVQKLVKVIKDKDVLTFWCKGDKTFVIPIDNTISRDPQQEDFECETFAEICKIRECSNEILKKKAQYEIPISWLILELELRNNGKVCIPLTEVQDICDRIMPSHRKMNVRQIREVLKFYHSFGMLLYFSEVDGMNNYIITNPEWLFLNLSKIVMCKFINNADDLYDLHLVEEMEKGICSMELLTRLKLDLEGIELNSFVNLLKYLKVIAPVKAFGNAYFVPNILPPSAEKQISSAEDYGKAAAFTLDGQYIHPEVEPLLIEFTFGTIPRGFFGSLVVQLLQDNPNTYELHENDHTPCQYADLISFFIKPCWNVLLHDRISYLELQVKVIGKQPSCHYKVQTAVTKALKTVCNDFNWQFGDCRYGFICCLHGEDSQEEKHLALLSESQPFPNVIPEYAYCKNWKPTPLSKAHTIWFEDVKKFSKLSNDKVPSETIASTAILPSIQSEVFNERPDMFDLIKIVIPKIMGEWEYIAYALRYDLATIKAIKEKKREDPKKCCEEFFKDWLTTDNGTNAGPKVWSTLFKILKEVNEISAEITEDIIVKVTQMK